MCSLSVGFYFIRKWRQPLMSKKRSELRMNRCCGRWKCIYGFLTLLVFSVLYGDSRQLGVAKRNLTEYGAKKKILFFIYFDIINLTKLLENING